MKLSGIVTAAIVVVILLFLIFTMGIINVAPTEVAVEVNKLAGKVNPVPATVGYHFYNRWKTDMVRYHVAARAFPKDTEKSEESDQYTLVLKTKDGQRVDVDLTVLYALIANDVPQLHQQVGRNYEQQILLPQVRSEGRLVIGSYSAEELYQGEVRQEVQDKARQKLGKSLAKYPAIQIHDVLIRHFEFSSDFEKAIERKKLAAQEVEINRNRALAQEEEAKRQEAEARGMKLKAIQEAEGRAQSAKIEADARRYKLEQEAAGNLAIYQAEAEGKRLAAQALGGGDKLVALTFAQKIPDKLQIWGIPTGQQNMSIMDLSGVFGNMLPKQ